MMLVNVPCHPHDCLYVLVIGQIFNQKIQCINHKPMCRGHDRSKRLPALTLRQYYIEVIPMHEVIPIICKISREAL